MTRRNEANASRDNGLFPERLFPKGLPETAEQVFNAPWQARAFALTVQLNDTGLLPWSTWTEVFSRQLARVQVPDRSRSGPAGDGYYRAWLLALQDVLQSLGFVTSDEVESVTEAWQAAAHVTPHGQPVELDRAREPAAG